MLILSAVLTFPVDNGTSMSHHISNAYGRAIGLLPRPTRRGQSWSWPGSAPHATRMHHYASLSSGQKSAWDAIAGEMNNDHSQHGITSYNGPIAYMQTNLVSRLRGDGYSDDAPAVGGDPGAIIAEFDAAGAYSFPINLIHTP